jgi:hypothetical protein
MQDNEISFEQRLELVDIELKEIGKIIEEMSESLDTLAKSLRGKDE